MSPVQHSCHITVIIRQSYIRIHKMNALLCIAVLTLLVISTSSLKLEYKCDKDAISVEIELKDTHVGLDEYHSGKKGELKLCPYDHNHIIKWNKETCGITLMDTNIYKLELKTTTYEVVTIRDGNFKIICDFNVEQTEQVIRVGPITVADKKSVGGTDVKEDIKLELYKDDTSVTTCDLGQMVRLRAELTVSETSDTVAIKVKSCTARETVGKTENVVKIIDDNGCNTDVISILADKGFERVSMTVDSYVSHTVKFPCFKLPQTLYVDVKCTAVDQYDEHFKNCEKSTGRQKREVSSARGGDLRLLIRVLPENSTLSTRTTLHSGDVCDHRSYLIGLVILGCVLALTVIVTVGMFVVIKRGRHGHESDQTAYANKGMS